jgi:oligopeptide transport system permease protein
LPTAGTAVLYLGNRTMLRFIARRLIETIPVLWVVVTVTFFMIRFAPGGPFTAEKAVTEEVRRNLEKAYGLDKPLGVQYLDYLKMVARGDLGPSFKYPNRTVNEIIADKLPTSLELGLLSLAVALGVGLPLGVLAAVKRNTWLDYLCSSTAMVGICVPTFVVGPLLVLAFALRLKWLPASGWLRWEDIISGEVSFIDLVRSRVLPCLTLGFFYAAYIARITRGGMLDVLNQDYIRTARAKGASETRVVFRHALRGGLLPVVSFLGPAIAGILTGSFVIETIFQVPGLGREIVNSAFNRDFTLVIGTTLLIGIFFILLNLASDIAQVWLNPKLKFEH